ncbi:MAG: hypothetical protein IIC54_09545 [Proteobacteria bacterium]|nr:hypothetical protein [Pseudomonadota bacterium]
MDTTNRINDLIAITGHLVDLLTQENAALRAKRHEDVAALLEKKASLSRAYESRVQGLVEKPDSLAQVDQALRQRLRGLGEKMHGLMEENAQFLKVAITVARRVVGSVSEAVKSSQPGPGTYSANGTVGTPGNGAAPRNLAISVDQSL